MKSFVIKITMQWIMLFLLWGFVQAKAPVISVDPVPSARFAFGSCNRFYESHKMDIFEKISEQKPSHMFFLGDFVYLDKFMYPNLPTVWYSQMDEAEIIRKINGVINSKEFKSFTDNNVTVEVVWDDHDYNQNNGGTNNPMRFKMLEIFKSFFKTTAIFEDSLHKLIKVDDRVTVILLDVRSYKTPDNMFNEETWQWLQRVFKNTTQEQLIFLSSGIQVIYDDRIMMESWDVSSRVRLYKLLSQYQTHVMVLSGDVHFGQMGVRQGLNEVTSSGLSFSAANHLPMVEWILKTFIPDTYSDFSERYAYRNFGLIEVSYHLNGSIDSVTAQIRDKNGDKALEKIIPFADTVLKELDWEDLGKDHKYIFKENMNKKLWENPLRLAVALPFLYPALYFILAILEMLHWKVD